MSHMIELTFLIDEGVFRYWSEKILEAAPKDADPVKKEAAELAIRKILEGQDESFRRIDPYSSPNEDVTWGTFKDATLKAIFHKAYEIYKETKSENP